MTSRRFASPSGSAAAESAPVSAAADVAEIAPEFPGCRPIRITRDAIADHESRIEYWDAATETAWVACEPNTIYHEGPGQVLGLDVSERLAARIAGENPAVLAAAAVSCRDEADLLARLDERPRAGRRTRTRDH